VPAGVSKTNLACFPELPSLSELTVFRQNRRSHNGLSIELVCQCVGLSLILSAEVMNYLPAESDTGMVGGNSNWRGPVWMPVNTLLLRALISFYLYYGDDFKIECPTGSGKLMNLFEVAREISSRLTRIFLRDQSGRRPFYGGTEKFQADPHWRDSILFYEYFHADSGAGLGASHQTGWTGGIAELIEIFGRISPEQFLAVGKVSAFAQSHPPLEKQVA
jgi:hypothetical protein